jgi:hypothetical protein
MLTAIFDRLKFRENLKCSLVCKRWHNVVNNNTQFMRTVRLRLYHNDLQYLHNMAATLTRDYRNLIIKKHTKFNDLTDIKISLFKKAENIWFICCIFQDFMEFKKVLDCCQNANEFFLYGIRFKNINCIPEEESKNKEGNEMVRPVKCTIESTDWRALQCFNNIYELDVIREDNVRSPSVREKLFLFENYAHTIKSIHLNEWTNAELLLLLKKGQLRSISSYVDDEIFLKFVLDDICQHLHNLETFNCLTKNLNYVNFNKLKKLKKLRSLFLTTYGNGDIFELDITELTLTELKMRILYSDLKILKKFSQPAMTSMKRLQILNTTLDQQAHNAIISLMPNLCFNFKVSLYLFVSTLC